MQVSTGLQILNYYLLFIYALQYLKRLATVMLTALCPIELPNVQVSDTTKVEG